MRTIGMLAVLFAASVAIAEDEKPAIKEIDKKGLSLATTRGGKATEPTTITSAEELEKNATVKAAAEEIKKHVDFDKQKLVVFAWAGSGQDKIAGDMKTEDKKSIAFFTYTRGLTRDLRAHHRLFVVPKDAEVKVGGK